MRYNRPAFLAELKEVAGIRRLHNDHGEALAIECSIIALEAGEIMESDWTARIARRFVHGLS